MQLVAVSSDDAGHTGELVRALGLHFPVLSDPSLAAITAWSDADPKLGLAWPTIYLVDRDGRVAWYGLAEGSGTAAALLAAIDRLGL